MRNRSMVYLLMHTCVDGKREEGFHSPRVVDVSIGHQQRRGDERILFLIFHKVVRRQGKKTPNWLVLLGRASNLIGVRWLSDCRGDSVRDLEKSWIHSILIQTHLYRSHRRGLQKSACIRDVSSHNTVSEWFHFLCAVLSIQSDPCLRK
jgi:hypothetical protein